MISEATEFMYDHIQECGSWLLTSCKVRSLPPTMLNTTPLAYTDRKTAGVEY